MRLPGRLLVPGLVNGHSHAFQRHLRGRVEVRAAAAPDDDFWSWRESMYAEAEALDPRGMRAVAEECFDAGRRAGYTAVGEFHYVHHRPDGTPYEEPNELALAVIEAARAVGVRIVVLMAAYARGGAGRGPTAGQRRFCDPSVEAYLARVERLAATVAGDPLVTVGYAPHSLRAVPREWLVEIAAHAAGTGYPLHVHAAEQPREVAESLEEFGLRPIEHLQACGVLGPAATVVHATHASEGELDLLAQTGSTVCACPTTEANLGDGFLPAAGLWERGVPVSFGADSNVRLDPFEEARETEGCARRQSGRRNVLVAEGERGPAPSLWRCLTDARRAQPRARADRHRRGRTGRPGRARPRHPEIRGVAAARPRRRRALQRHSSARARDLGGRLHDRCEAARRADRERAAVLGSGQCQTGPRERECEQAGRDAGHAAGCAHRGEREPRAEHQRDAVIGRVPIGVPGVRRVHAHECQRRIREERAGEMPEKAGDDREPRSRDASRQEAGAREQQRRGQRRAGDRERAGQQFCDLAPADAGRGGGERKRIDVEQTGERHRRDVSGHRTRRDQGAQAGGAGHRRVRVRERDGFAMGRTPFADALRSGSTALRSALVVAPVASQPAATTARTYAPGAPA